MIKISIFIVFSLKPYYVDKKLVYHLPSLVCAFSIHLCIHLYKNLSISSLKSIFNFISFYFLFFSFIYLFFFSQYAAGDCPDNYYWNGTQCSACSGCPVGFGLREPCSKTKNTECQECYPGYDYSNSTGMEECIK